LQRDASRMRFLAGGLQRRHVVQDRAAQHHRRRAARAKGSSGRIARVRQPSETRDTAGVKSRDWLRFAGGRPPEVARLQWY
jgi:hypothetical protein